MARALLALCVLLLVGAGPAAAQPKLGAVQFANSGAPAAQEPFLRGLALLHNFEYADAAAAFRQAQAADPDFALAYWGEAMTYNHPVWMEQDLEKARAALARLGPTPAARLARTRTRREAAYLQAVETLYGEGTKEERDVRYAAAMADVHRSFPDDIDAAAFHALALLGTAHEGRDVATYMRAASLLEEVYPENRGHPGVLHYLIHSYDDPTHAPLGVRAARLYGEVAPNAGHALHMTSHIFVALGQWDDVIAANRQAMKVVNERQAADGKPPYGCGHYVEWLAYAYLQKGQIADADREIGACRVDALAELAKGPQPKLDAVRSRVLSYADLLARRAVETGQWRGDNALLLEDGAYLRSRFLLAYGEAIGSQRDAAQLTRLSGQLAATLKDLAAAGVDETTGLRSGQIMAGQVAALAAIAAGREQEGLAELRRVAEIEAAAPVEFGPPAVFKPTLELIGDQLLALGRKAEAADAYRAALARAPGRTLALEGLQRAGG